MLRRPWVRFLLGALVTAAVVYGSAGRMERRPDTASTGQVQARVGYIYQGDLWLDDLGKGPPRRLTRDGNNARPAWSPSGRWVLVEKANVAWVLDTTGGGARRVSADSTATAARWAPQLDRLAFADDRGRLWVVNPDGSGQRQVAGPPMTEPAGAAIWSPDGKWLAFSAGVGQGPATGLWRVPAAGGKAQLLYQQSSGERPCVFPAAWTAGGSVGGSTSGGAILVWSGPMCTPSILADGLTLYLVPVDGRVRALGDTLAHSEFVAPSPAGPVAAVLGAGRMTWTHKRLAVFSAQGEGPAHISPEGVAAIGPAWSPSGWLLAYVAQTDLGEVGGERVRAGMMERRIILATPDGAPGGGVPPRKLTGDPRFRDESPRWVSDSQILFARLDKQGKASLWLMGLRDPEPRLIAEVDPPPLGGFGYYGWIDWQRLFDVWRPAR